MRNVMSLIRAACRELSRRLEVADTRIVLAESCTGGLVAASLSQVPGISRFLCGSAVTYRDATKAEWLRVRQETLRRVGAVSEETAGEMVAGVLGQTPEAGLAAAVTGHLGPGAPADQDGMIFVGIARRRRTNPLVRATCIRLTTRGRIARQREATLLVLRALLDEVPDRRGRAPDRRGRAVHENRG